MRSTCSAVPARPTPSRHSSVSGVAHLLSCGAGVEADAPAQPVGAGGEAVAPALARVELSDEIQKTRGGGFEVRRELGDFVAETIERGGRAGEREHVCREHVHGESPPAEATLHRDFGGSSEARHATIGTQSTFSRRGEAPRLLTSLGDAETPLFVCRRLAAIAHAASCQESTF